MKHLLLFLPLICIDPIQAQEFDLDWSATIPVGSSGEGFVSPRVQVNASGAPVVLWGRSSPAANFVAVHNGGGFDAANMIHPPTLSPMSLSWTGGDLAAYGDTLWAVMKASPTSSRPCYAVQSTDGGSTWGDTMRVDRYDDGLYSEFPSIAIVPGQGPIVQYMQTDVGLQHPRYVTMRMVNGAFEPAVQISNPFAPGEVCDCCPGQILTDGSNTVALYRNAGSNIRVIWGAASADDGASYTAGAALDATGWVAAVCPSSGPDGYLVGDSIRYAWMSAAGGNTRVYIGTAHLPDLVPGPQRQIAPTTAGSQNFPKIDGSGDTLGVAWVRGGNGVSGILFSYSTTGVAGLSAPDTVAWGPGGANQTPDVRYHNGVFHLVWTDAPGQVVRYRSAALVPATAVSEINEGPGLRVWPVPARDLLHVAGTFTGKLGFAIIDARGRIVREGTILDRRIPVAGLDPGAYVLKLSDATGDQVLRIVLE